MRGRRPSVKLADPAAGGEGEGSGYQPDPPDTLTTSARAKWDEIVPRIARLCQLRETDADALAAYCEAAALKARALREMEGKSLVLVTANGAEQINPLIKIAERADAFLVKLSERFGLTPADRKRLQLASAAGKGSKFAEFLSGGNPRTIPPTEAE
jgi:P27 family predicted phage terminase small subunit